MPSSISASRRGPWSWLKILASFSVLWLVGLEILFGHPMKERSATYRRVSRQYADALSARRSKDGEPTSVLMVGNSLLLDGVDVPRLRASTSDRLRLYPIFLEFSSYYDWLYALDRLFRLGSRPDVVVVGLGPDSLIENAVRAEYSPLLLLDADDVRRVSDDVGLDRTASVNLLLAHWSTFWDLRRVFRVQLMRHLIPYAEDFFAVVRPRRDASFPSDGRVEAARRLRQLQTLTGKYGSRLIFLIPPTPASETGIRSVTVAARTVGVNVLVPIDPVTLSESCYQPDGIHLNTDGATRFTSALVRNLPDRITATDRLAATPE